VSARALLIVGRLGQLATDLTAIGRQGRAVIVARGRPELDITDRPSIERALDEVTPAAVINAAAYTAVDKAESEPDLAYAINRDGPAHLAAVCAGRGLPLIHISTDQVFDGSKAGPYAEGDTPNPLCVYGHSKLAGEGAVAAANEDHLVVRVSWVFGPSGDNFVTKLIAWARQRPKLTIVADQRGRPTYSPALAAALIDLAQRMAAGGADRPRGLLHVAGASVMTRYEQALAVMRATAARGGPTAAVEPIATRDFAAPAARPLNAELDVSLAASCYGVRLGPFEADLTATLDAIIGPVKTGS
jgi:dTDP-4-dehydrorhamnose reductase